MNKSLLLTMISTLTLLGTSAAYAEQSDCDKNAIHCAFITGLPNNFHEGRYIKLKKAHEYTIECVNRTTTFELFSAYIKSEGTQTLEFSICNEILGKTCEPIGQDVYEAVKNGKKYTINPPFYNVVVPESLLAKYPACYSFG